MGADATLATLKHSGSDGSDVKYLRLTARPPPELAPKLFRTLALSDRVDEARAVAVDVSVDRGITALFSVTGEQSWVVDEFEEAPEVRQVETAPATGAEFYLLAALDPREVPPLTATFEQVARGQLVVYPPVVYDERGVHLSFVGTAPAIRNVVDALPASIDVEAHEIGEHGPPDGSAASQLSPRQREAVLAALELGYYDHPRQATHADVADRLECAPSTASEHLRKAEAALVNASFGPQDR